MKGLIYDLTLVGSCYIYWTGLEMIRVPAIYMSIEPDKNNKIKNTINMDLMFYHPI